VKNRYWGNYCGLFIQDCLSSYFKFEGAKYSPCGAHILSELKGFTHHEERKWPKLFKDFLLEVLKMPFVSNCFRTAKGADICARIEGFLSTVRKQNRNVFTEL
jgi:hypothetical protein